MKSLRFRPLLLAHVDELLKAKDRLTNSYEVFHALVRVWLLREIGKMEQQKLTPIPTEAELWEACRLLAVYLQILGKRELAVEALGELMRQLARRQALGKTGFRRAVPAKPQFPARIPLFPLQHPRISSRQRRMRGRLAG